MTARAHDPLPDPASAPREARGPRAPHAVETPSGSHVPQDSRTPRTLHDPRAPRDSRAPHDPRSPHDSRAPHAPRERIAHALAARLAAGPLAAVHFAERGVAPPALAYVTGFPRLSLPLSGRHPMDLARAGRIARLAPGPGEAVFVPANAWNRPSWSEPVEVLTLLFGKRQAGLSLVAHDGRAAEPTEAAKTRLDGTLEGVTRHLVDALSARAGAPSDPALDRLLAEALLRAVLAELTRSEPSEPRKALRTYEALCLFVQENFHLPITRDAVARHFGLSPNHVSRLFRREGHMRFCDYLTRVRIDRAKLLLQEYDGTLKEVAASCGFRDVPYLCRVFRKTTRTTPTHYRLARRGGSHPA